MIKALFFDIDGTIVSFKTHSIPESTVEALTLAKANGIDIYISTGRPYSLIDNITQIEHLIDGYITTNGAFCFHRDNVISCSPLSLSDVKSVLDQSDEAGFACMVVGEKDLTMHNPNPYAEQVFKDLLNVSDISKVPLDTVLSQRILQLTPVITEEEQKEVFRSLKSVEIGRWCPEFADVTAADVSKAKGLYDMARYLGFDPQCTMAFGDGGNDLSIIKASGTGVAMGNANIQLKKAADYVTTGVDDDGIFNALRHFGII